MFYAVCLHIFREFQVMSTPIWGHHLGSWIPFWATQLINQHCLVRDWHHRFCTITGWWLSPTPPVYESVGMMIIHNIWKNKKCSKPPTRLYMYIYIYIVCVSYNAANQGAKKSLIYLHQLFAIEPSAGILSNPPPPKKNWYFPCSSGLPHFLPTISWSTWKTRFARWDCSDLNL